jgi:hypothetical protein
MPAAPPLIDVRIPRSEIARLHREIEQYLTHQATTTRTPAATASLRGVPRPDAAEMVRQAGIVTGPAPRQPGRLARALHGRPGVRADPITVAAHLDVTARIIEIYGWAQNTTWDRQRRCCIIGAQSLAVHLGYGDRHLAGEAGAWLDRQLGGGIRYWQWQNNRHRTKQQVLDVLRQAAADARKVGHS